VKRANAWQDADAIKQDYHDGTSALVTLRALTAPTLGCADNGLAGIRRQCFHLALPPRSRQTVQMSNLYVDHSAITDETWWPQIDAAVATGRVRLAVSLWNLVEIGSATDLKQRERRITFLERNDPLWIVERVGVQRQEVKRFLWINRFGVPRRSLSSSRRTFAWSMDFWPAPMRRSD
jgi:hypothetical protein